MRDWWVYSEAIAEGSSVQAVEGRNYFRSIRLHKQSFEALVRYRIQKHLDKTKFLSVFKRGITDFRKDPSPLKLKALMDNPEFQMMCGELLTTRGTESMMVVAYIRDVSHLLALVSAVREGSIECHLQAKRALLPKLFAFGHPNYARYLTYQHVTLEMLKSTNPSAWRELQTHGFGGSISGEPFSTVHGDYITETTINREVKVRGGPMQGGYSTSQKAIDFHKDKSYCRQSPYSSKGEVAGTSSTHKETTSGARKVHENTVSRLVEQMEKYLDPFADGPARNFKTGKMIDEDVVKGLMTSSALGDVLYMEFVDQRLKRTGEDRVDFFKPIKNPKLKTGLEKPKKESRVIDVLKEEKQAFGSFG